ncbi:hypothetical protein U1Q18_040304 [Sarracenia purpurea var. burkii]
MELNCSGRWFSDLSVQPEEFFFSLEVGDHLEFCADQFRRDDGFRYRGKMVTGTHAFLGVWFFQLHLFGGCFAAHTLSGIQLAPVGPCGFDSSLVGPCKIIVALFWLGSTGGRFVLVAPYFFEWAVLAVLGLECGF